MQCTIPSQNVKILARGLHSFSRIGDEIYVEPANGGLSFRTVNAGQSAYSIICFKTSFFSSYCCQFDPEESGRCKVSMRAFLSIFKTPHCMDRNVDSCKIEIDSECVNLSFQIHFMQGYTKFYLLNIADNENVQLQYNKDEQCNKMCILSKTLHSAIKHFRLNDEEITLTVTEDKAHLQNYCENIDTGNKKLVRTNISLESTEFELFEIKEVCSVTFTFKELRAVCTFSELSNSPINIYFDKAGKPVIFSVSNDLAYEVDFVVSTLPQEMMIGEQPKRRSQLSDIISTMPSSCISIGQKRKLAPIYETAAASSESMDKAVPLPSICNNTPVLEPQDHKIDTVFRYCFDYSADRSNSFSADEILCGASDVEF